MKEQFLDTSIADEISIMICFDYQPVERQTHDDPGCDSDVTINGVLVDDNINKDILSILNDKALDTLKMECFEMMEGGGWNG